MSGINKVIILGRLGNEPEVRRTDSGATICIMSVATTEKWKDKQTGQPEERTEWHRIKFFGGLADFVAGAVGKGCRIFVEGKLLTEKWRDAEGNDRYTTVVIGQKVEMVDWKENNQNQGYQNQHSQAQQQHHQQAAPDFDDESIPF